MDSTRITGDSDLVALLSRAAAIVEDAGLPEPLRATAFAKVVDLLESPARGGTGTRDQRRRDVPDGDPLASIASRLGLPMDVVEQVYVVESGELEIVVSAGRLASAKSQATEQIALLVAAGRQAAGLDGDGWTPADAIRAVCEQYKKHDSSNFATSIKGLDHTLNLRGSGRNRKLKMTAPAWDKATELVQSLTSNDG